MFYALSVTGLLGSSPKWLGANGGELAVLAGGEGYGSALTGTWGLDLRGGAYCAYCCCRSADALETEPYTSGE
jgi:hypothetical protein